MQANSDGLSPSLRPFLGIGWNRALRAPFGFGNGIVPDGSNDYLLIPGLVGQTWPIEGTIELWVSVQSARGQRELEITFNDGRKLRLTASQPIPLLEVTGSAQPYAAAPNGIYNYGSKYHCAYMWDATKTYAWGNAVMPNTILGNATSGINANINLVITGAALCGQVDGFLCSTSKLDEVRFYNRKLTIDELVLNDNSGIGNNPSDTENLFGWYTFEQFETLDFSALQDNSDLRLGVRDMSGHNHHAQAKNMDTNGASGGYVLKPF